MKNKDVNNLLNRHLQGEASDEENRQVESWLAASGEESTEWKEKDTTAREQWLSELYSDILTTTRSAADKPPVIHRSLGLSRKFAMSAAALLLLACGLYLSWPSLQQWLNPVSEQLRATSGKPALIVLNDGTRVWLNSRSGLRYPEAFNGSTREVYLEGEAYFEVARNADKPFIVHTGKLSTRVLGTVFNIRAYAGASDVKIVLSSGKVEVINEDSSTNSRLTLMPNQMAVYQKQGGSLSKAAVSNVLEYSAWKDGKLIFDETPVAEVLERLGHVYGVKFVVADEKSRGCTITGSFDANQKIEEILQSISVSIDGKFTKEANQYTFNAPGCS